MAAPATILLWVGAGLLAIGLCLQLTRARRSRDAQIVASALFLLALVSGIGALVVRDAGSGAVGYLAFLFSSAVAALGASLAARFGLIQPLSTVNSKSRHWKRVVRDQSTPIVTIWGGGVVGMVIAAWLASHTAPLSEARLAALPGDTPALSAKPAATLDPDEVKVDNDSPPVASTDLAPYKSNTEPEFQDAPDAGTEMNEDLETLEGMEARLPGNTVETEMAEETTQPVEPSETLEPVEPDPVVTAPVVPVVTRKKAFVPAQLSAREKSIFPMHIKPILQRRCYECHGEKKQKADLRLDSPDHIRAGRVVVGGSPERSAMYTLVGLPHDDPDIMPPKDKPLTRLEIKKIKAWIERGGFFGDGKDAVLERKNDSMEGDAALVAAIGDANLVARLKEAYILVRPLEDGLLEVNASHADSIDWKLITPLAAKIQVFILRKTKTGDEEMANVSAMKNLADLNLADTSVGDVGLRHLAGLDKLEALNIYGTKVTDEGLKHLHGLKSLERVYLWDSGATKSGARLLRKKLPGTDVNFGGDLD